jgi:cytochrome c5
MAKLTTMILLLAGAVLLNPGVRAEAGEEIVDDSEIVSWQARYLELGEDVYDWVCSACHTSGEGGAPRIGHRDEWDSRSHLWSAVLLEHAKSGYLEMPAKGGHAYLSDRAVEAAGEFMLTETFPELPRD